MRTKMLSMLFVLLCPFTSWGQMTIVWDIPDSLREVILFDDFEDNRNEWPMESEFAKLKINKGVYEIDHSKGEGNYSVSYDGFDFSGEFAIECKMRKTKGDNDSIWYGIMWGYQTTADYCNLLVGADGTYQLAVSSRNEYKEMVDWTDHSSLEKKSKFNVLRVERRANTVTIMGKKLKNMDQYKYHFFLNGALVKTVDDWPAVWGDSIGFRMSEEVKVEVDYVKVTVP